MKVEPIKELTIRDVVEDYEDLEEEGVTGYGGRLNIRPKYQREFVYNEKQRAEVINTVKHGFPLNSMYWMKTEDGDYELLDGQQRTVSICQYFDGVFAFEGKYFHNLTSDEQERFLNYKLHVYECEGTDSERLEWFKVINFPGAKLTDQELRNAVYTGAWLTDAKRRFSKTNCVADQLAGDYMNGSPIRQEYLETVLAWAADKDGVPSIEQYMGLHQHDANANELWLYFRKVHNWLTGIFPDYNKLMKGLPWGIWYNQHGERTDLDPDEIRARVDELLQDKEVQKKKGIYEFILTGNENVLSLRVFDEDQKQEAYARQKGICVKCGEHFEFDEMEGDHIIPWSKGGKTIPENCQMLCKHCNGVKSNK